MAKSLKPDLNYHTSMMRHYQLTIDRKIPRYLWPECYLSSTFFTPCTVYCFTHLISVKMLCIPSSSIQTTVLRLLWISDLSCEQLHVLEDRGSREKGTTGPNSKQQRIREKVIVSGRSFLYSLENRRDLHLALVYLPRPKVFQVLCFP